MSGPAPEPTILKALRGNPGKRALNRLEPQPAPFDGTPPDWLTGSGRALWDDLAPKLIALGLLTSVDAHEFALGCEARVRGLELLQAGGDAVATLRLSTSIFARYGIGASDRSRIVVAPPVKVKSKWAGLVPAKDRGA